MVRGIKADQLGQHHMAGVELSGHHLFVGHAGLVLDTGLLVGVPARFEAVVAVELRYSTLHDHWLLFHLDAPGVYPMFNTRFARAPKRECLRPLQDRRYSTRTRV